MIYLIKRRPRWPSACWARTRPNKTVAGGLEANRKRLRNQKGGPLVLECNQDGL